MQVSGINKNFIYYKNNYYFSNSKKAKSNSDNSIEQIDLNFKDASIINKNIAKVSFLGYNVFITDGGNHAQNMLHFAKAISHDMEPIIKDVKILPNQPNMKFLKDLVDVLKQLPLNNNLYNQYVAVPASASVPLLNLQDQVNRIMKTNIKLTPENIKAHKPLLLDFLKKIYETPEKYREYIGYMDNDHQGIEHTFGVIKQINNLIKNYHAKVYVPAGHPFDETMKWMAGQRNLKPELYNFIATGEDQNGAVKAMQQEIKDKNWYNFNLLTLSDARNITIKNKGWNKDYIFAGYDTCTTDGARGVYNFSPVRDDNKKLIGYSYTDTKTNEYPFKEFPANDEVANLAKYVGLDADDVIANRGEIIQYKSGIYKDKLLNKLYPIEEIFSKYEIADKKLRLRGDYVDSTKKLFFRKNNENKIIFPYTDCEGSGKPSVLPMWGCCFAVFNAIKKDIYYDKLAKQLYNTGARSYGAYLIKKDNVMTDLLNKARNAYKNRDFNSAEMLYNEAIDASKASEKYGFEDITPYIEQGEMFFKLYDFGKASGCFNTAITKLSRNINNYLSIHKLKFIDIKLGCEKYKKHVNEYNDVLKIADIYRKIGIICFDKGETESAVRCFKASSEIKNCTITGEKLIARRAEHNMYIGDIIK